MDLVIQAAQQLGKVLQQDDRYLGYQLALQTSEEDLSLNEKIGQFEERRIQLTEETEKEKPDLEALKRLEQQVQQLYDEVMVHPAFVAFTSAQQEMRLLLSQVNGIIKGSSEGEDPEQIQFTPECSSGGCSGCSGCHEK